MTNSAHPCLCAGNTSFRVTKLAMGASGRVQGTYATSTPSWGLSISVDPSTHIDTSIGLAGQESRRSPCCQTSQLAAGPPGSAAGKVLLKNSERPHNVFLRPAIGGSERRVITLVTALRVGLHPLLYHPSQGTTKRYWYRLSKRLQSGSATIANPGYYRPIGTPSQAPDVAYLLFTQGKNATVCAGFAGHTGRYRAQARAA